MKSLDQTHLIDAAMIFRRRGSQGHGRGKSDQQESKKEKTTHRLRTG